MSAYYNYYHIVLLSVVVGNVVCMEQQAVIKCEKRMSGFARNLIERSEKFKDKCVSCCGKQGLNDEEKWNALVCATYYEKSKAVKNLLADGALTAGALEHVRSRDVCFSDIHTQTFPRLDVLPLTVALFTKNEEIIGLLKEKSTLEDTMCPLSALAVYMGDWNLLETSIKNKDFDPDYADRCGGSLLQLAVRGGHEGIVIKLLENPDISKNINESYGVAPVLFIAAQRGFCAIAELLCKFGADPNKKYKNGSCGIWTSPIYIAAKYKHLDMVKFLCKQPGVIANGRHTEGDALDIAIRSNEVEIVRVLLNTPDIQVDINDVDRAKREYNREIECLLWRWLYNNKKLIST